MQALIHDSYSNLLKTRIDCFFFIVGGEDTLASNDIPSDTRRIVSKSNGNIIETEEKSTTHIHDLSKSTTHIHDLSLFWIGKCKFILCARLHLVF